MIIDTQYQRETIENYPIIGANLTLLPGVTIGRVAVVVAGLVVTKNVSAGMMAVENPTRNRELP